MKRTVILTFAAVLAPALLALAGCAGQDPRGVPVVSAIAKPTKRELADAERRKPSSPSTVSGAIATAQDNGGVRLAVPIAQAFEPGSTTVKPPLAAVLDRLADERRDSAEHIRIKVPNDAGSRTLLVGMERAISTRSYLEERGIPASRCSIATTARGREVELIVGGT